jgi:hypothetical protein
MPKRKSGYKQAVPRHRTQAASSADAQERAIEKAERQAAKNEWMEVLEEHLAKEMAMTINPEKKVGILDADGRLVAVSDCNSQAGGAYDGPCLWPSLESAISDNEDYGGLADDCRYVKVTVTVEEFDKDHVLLQ